MSRIDDWKTQFETEIEQAESARQTGNEGMARVCARRAAGIVAGQYLIIRGLPVPGPSAVDRLNSVAVLPDTTPEIRETIRHLLIRVTPEHRLPIEADLIADARLLKDHLLTDEKFSRF